ncbi:MAG: DEAD/DEAH box helicase [Negativicutes bacterium]|nr:DEAD/DEAH box helicase [Negativicutes bacterium]
MNFTPHAYQKHSIDYILDHPTAALFLDCGLGKTVISLTAIFDLTLDSFQIRKVLIIAPLRVARDTWSAEIEKWDHLKGLAYSIAVGTEYERKTAFRNKAQVYLINRENVPWLIQDSGLPFDFDMIVVDELSSFKSHQAKRFKSLVKVRPKVKRIVGLTGTPSANGLMDLWSEFRLLDLGQRLGRFIGNFRASFFVPDKRNQQMVFSYKPKPGAEEAIYRKISDITISMKNTDYLKMPELVMNEISVRLSEDEWRHYQTMKKDMVVSLDGKDIDAVNAAALSGKLLQMANGAIYDESGDVVQIHNRKLDALEDIIEAANGKPVLIAYWFKHDLKRILERFPGEQLDSEDSIRRWNNGKIPLALIHPASAGHGLNLQAGGCALVWFSLTWSLELYQQTNARLWRQGQKETVVVHHIIAKNTIDENVMAALAKKNTGQTALLRAVKAKLGRG